MSQIKRITIAALMAALCVLLTSACHGSAESRRAETCRAIADRFDAVLAGEHRRVPH
jgi:hypothetical protein